MQYPLISEYIEAIRSAEDNFDKLSNLRPVLDSDGNPVMSSGNFAVVFKMEDVSTHRLFAVKCFIKEQEGRGERYALIAEELQYVSSPYLLHVRYLERELFVSTAGCDEEEFPVLVMDWVEGQPLDAYLKQHLNNRYDLEMLAYRICKMGAWLLSQPFAHGDLKPDNILVREDGSLVLVDYDGMYVPAMKGMKAEEMGSPDYNHPLRREDDFNEHIDDFSVSTIALSLMSIAIEPVLFIKHGVPDSLLFHSKDFFDLGNSMAIKDVISLVCDNRVASLLSLFLQTYANKVLNDCSSNLIQYIRPRKVIYKRGIDTSAKWDIKSYCYFTLEEKELVKDAQMVYHEGKKSIQFNMKDGRVGHIPCHDRSFFIEGEYIKMDNIIVLTLSRIGDTDRNVLIYKS